MQILDADVHVIDLQTRLPFKYGIATMTQAPHVLVRLQVEIEGDLATGISADHLPPKWFRKDPDQAIRDELLEMADVVEHAAEAAVALEHASAFEIWQELYRVQHIWGNAHSLPPLLYGFGASLVERALLDAVCRSCRQPFWQLVRSGALGLRLDTIHPELAGKQPADFLPPRPLETVIARHTIGMADPLLETDIEPDARLNDGLPQSLEACCAAYGLRHFKIKCCGDAVADADRLARVADVVSRHRPLEEIAFSVDGNEHFTELEAFRSWWERLHGDPRLAGWFKQLLFVEQPLHRDVALDPGVIEPLAEWSERPRMIIDESDATLDSLPQALALGYAGTSHKNCKGVFQGVANACLLAHRRRHHPDGSWIMSGEDLANIGPIALPADLAVAASLGVESIERNGHHYFAGLSMFPETVQRQVLEHHGDLYHPSEAGWPTLRLSDGRLDLTSVNAAPLGVAFELDVEQFTPIAQWRSELK